MSRYELSYTKNQIIALMNKVSIKIEEDMGSKDHCDCRAYLARDYEFLRMLLEAKDFKFESAHRLEGSIKNIEKYLAED
jgi:hypothetical protein